MSHQVAARLHLTPTQPGIAVEGTARRLVEELEGAGLEATWVDLGECFAGEASRIALDPETALASALDTVEGAGGEVQVTSARLPAALQPVGFGLHARLAATLGAGLVLVAGAEDEQLAKVARIQAAREHATMVGVRLAGAGWVGGTEEAPLPPRQPVVGGEVLVGTGDSIGEVLSRLSPGISVVVPAERVDVLLGLTVALGSGRVASPAVVSVTGNLSEPLLGLWRRFTPDVPLIIADEAGAPAGGDIVRSARKVLAERPVRPLLFQRGLLHEARTAGRHIVLPEGEEPRILRAAAEVLRSGGARLTLLGETGSVHRAARDEGVDVSGAQIIDPGRDPLRERFATEYARLRARKGVTHEQAYERMADVSYFGTMMVHAGLADGMVSGAVHTTAHTIRPAFEVIRAAPEAGVVSSVFFMCLPDRVLVFGDCAVNPNPDAEQLAGIAAASAVTAEQFGLTPRVALLSYSTGTSGSGPDVELVAEATGILRRRAPGLCADGPLQFDAAVVEEVARSKAPGSPVAGHANVLIFPTLSAGNTAYKAVQRTAGALAIGPVLQGLNKPVNDLSRGALVDDIINTILITAIQAGRNS